MRRVVLMTMLLASAACASGPSLQSAVSLHNTTKRIVEAADHFAAPIYTAAAEEADRVSAGDDAAYKKAMAPYDLTMKALQEAKRAEQILQLAVAQWQQGADDGTMTHEVAACVSADIAALAPLLADLPAGEWLYGAAGVLAAQLAGLADGAKCSPHTLDGPLKETLQ